VRNPPGNAVRSYSRTCSQSKRQKRRVRPGPGLARRWCSSLRLPHDPRNPLPICCATPARPRSSPVAPRPVPHMRGGYNNAGQTPLRTPWSARARCAGTPKRWLISTGVPARHIPVLHNDNPSPGADALRNLSNHRSLNR
jgi:hypothetical protein